MKKAILILGLIFIVSCESELMEHEIIYETVNDTIKISDTVFNNVTDTLFLKQYDTIKVYDTIRVEQIVIDTIYEKVYDT